MLHMFHRGVFEPKSFQIFSNLILKLESTIHPDPELNGFSTLFKFGWISLDPSHSCIWMNKQGNERNFVKSASVRSKLLARPVLSYYICKLTLHYILLFTTVPHRVCNWDQGVPIPRGPHEYFIPHSRMIPKNSSSSSDVPQGLRGTKSSLFYVEIEYFCAHKIQFECIIL